MRRIKNSEIESFFGDKENGVHRYNTEEFLQLEADEKLFHLGDGDSLLDFGCGTADLLVYYAAHFKNSVGADLSENMLSRASKRLASFGLSNVRLLQANDKSVWETFSADSLDVITTAAVMQYLTGEQIADFVDKGSIHLKQGGRFVFFDMVDPNIYWMFRYGVYSDKFSIIRNIWRGLSILAKGSVKSLATRLSGRAFNFNVELGNTHFPAAIAALATQRKFNCRIVRSMYYEYRYHVILTKPGIGA